MPVTLLVGAEGCSECKDEPWLRDPTPEEAERFKQQYPQLQSIDPNGRPYWLKTVTDDAPAEVLGYVKKMLRVVRPTR